MNLLQPDPHRPFRWLYLDLNAYFASVEEQERAELRGRPVGVVQVAADNACVIAASYEAKRFGVRTGTLVYEARALCPELELVEARHRLYVEYHERILTAVETVVPVEKVCSIDEMRARLLETEAGEAEAVRVAKRVKRAIKTLVGKCLTCSIGLAPNPFLAKIATELQKPDGLVHLRPEELEERLADWKLTDFPGINRRMAVRLNLSGVYTVRQLLRSDEQSLRKAFGGVVGARWYHLLRGRDLPDSETKRRTLGHSHVLPPEFRSRDGSYQVMLRLLEKAAARLRREGLAARGIAFKVRARGEGWKQEKRLDATQDTLKFIETLQRAWPKNAMERPTQVSVTLFDLFPAGQMTLSLLAADNRGGRLAHAVDRVNSRFGKHKILPAALMAAKETAPERIAFTKATLFDEGNTAA
ncbi:MAG: DNA polymerase [Armatimonadetes bacterium]|nr:DNA polymerase [Armatimonadota bacterium]